MTTKIIRVGNTLTVEVPEDLLSRTGIRTDQAVEWVVTDGVGLTLISNPDFTDDSMDSSGALGEVADGEDEAAILMHIQAGQEDFAAGQAVSHERVVAWLDSWGTENELPVPECD